ncbi:MAG: hypothetical protein ACRDBP_10010 [Luteolibacter sp.]
MKNTIRTFAVTTLVFALATTASYAGSQVANHGRAGYAVTPKVERQHSHSRSATTVALTMEKPEQAPTRIKNSGRGGYTAVPNSMNR